MKLRLAAAFAALAVAVPAAVAQPAPQPAARAFLVENAATGEVLLARNAFTPGAIASITKLMTALIVVERARLDEMVVVARAATAVEGSTIHLVPGERITVRDLLKATLIESANDAAFALAFHVGAGSVEAFVRMMNAKAAALGLRYTNFTRPDGLDARGHVSTARDVTTLAQVAMRNPVVRGIVDDRTATISGGRRLANWNDLLGAFPGVIGVKTGHTARAGWSQVAAARGRGYTIYATILGSPTRERRNQDLRQLLAWGLTRYRVVDAVQTRRVYAEVETQYGREPARLVARKALPRVVRVGVPLREVVVAPAQIRLPLRRGASLGRVEVWAGKRLLAEQELVAANGVERPGWLERTRWYAARSVSNAIGAVT